MKFTRGLLVCVLACWVLLESGSFLLGTARVNADEESFRDSVTKISLDLDSLRNKSEVFQQQINDLKSEILETTTSASERDQAISVPSFAWLILIVIIGLSTVLALTVIVLGSWALWRSMNMRPAHGEESKDGPGELAIFDHPRLAPGIVDDGLIFRGVDKQLVPGLQRSYHLLREIEALLFYFTISSSRADSSAQEARSTAFKSAVKELQDTYDEVLSGFTRQRRNSGGSNEVNDKPPESEDAHPSSS